MEGIKYCDFDLVLDSAWCFVNLKVLGKTLEEIGCCLCVCVCVDVLRSKCNTWAAVLVP